MRTNLTNIINGTDHLESEQNQDGTWLLLVSAVIILFIFYRIKMEIYRKKMVDHYSSQFEDERRFLQIFNDQSQWPIAIDYYPAFEPKITQRLISETGIFLDNISNIYHFCKLASFMPTLSEEGARLIVNDDNLFKHYIDGHHKDLKHKYWIAFASSFPNVHDQLIDRLMALDDFEWSRFFPNSTTLARYLQLLKNDRLSSFIVERLIANPSVLFLYVQTDDSEGFNDVSLLLKTFPENVNKLLDVLYNSGMFAELNKKKSGFWPLLNDSKITEHHEKIAEFCVNHEVFLKKLILCDAHQLANNPKHKNFQTRFPQFAAKVAELQKMQFDNFLVSSANNIASTSSEAHSDTKRLRPHLD